MRTELEAMAGKKVYNGWPPTSTSAPAPPVRVTLLPHPTVRR